MSEIINYINDIFNNSDSFLLLSLEYSAVILCIIIISYLVLKWFNCHNNKTLFAQKNKYNDSGIKISESVVENVGCISKSLIFLALLALWSLWCVYFDLDFFICLTPPFVILYLIMFYRYRNNVRYDEKYRGTESETPSVHDSYLIRRKGIKSYNPILFILDWLFQWCPEMECTLLAPFSICGFPFYGAAYWISVINSEENSISLISKILFYFLVVIGVIYILRIDRFYRWLRHRHFKKNNLPGPYGWGTLDFNRRDTYEPFSLGSFYK